MSLITHGVHYVDLNPYHMPLGQPLVTDGQMDRYTTISNFSLND